jgi:hypothetical protein
MHSYLVYQTLNIVFRVMSGHLIVCVGEDFLTRRRLVGMSLAVNVGACELVRWCLQRTQFMYTSSESHVMWKLTVVSVSLQHYHLYICIDEARRDETRNLMTKYTFNCHLLHWPCKICILRQRLHMPVTGVLMCTSGAEPPGQLTNYWILPTTGGNRTDQRWVMS